MVTSVSIFIFHRDLRLYDNTSLIALCEKGYPVIPIFVFTPEQINQKKNEYFSHPSVQFMCESLVDLDYQFAKYKSRLSCYEGNTLSIIQDICKSPNLSVKAIGWNQDYSVFAEERDSPIRIWCTKEQIELVIKEDYGLLPLKEGLLPGTNKPYMVLSQFFNRILKDDTIPPINPYKFKTDHFIKRAKFSHLQNVEVQLSQLDRYYTPTPQLAIHGGRSLGLQILDRIKAGEYKQYDKERDFPSLHKTTRASPHLKFGTISIREMYWTIRESYGKKHSLIRELVFRDFYLKIYATYPELQRGKALRYELDKLIPWKYDEKLINAWKEGRTGYPLVDAGMRELNTTGHQHNRIRMLCSSVLTKYFLVDWRIGLKYYYQHLVDADIYSNTAGWGFSSSTGPDAVPYFRAPFNPFIQSKKFDKDASYIYQWVPELKGVSPSDIHKWDDPKIRAKYPTIQYPVPIIDHKEASARAVKIYRDAGATVFLKTHKS